MPHDVGDLSLDDIEERLRAFAPDPARPHDRWSLIAIEQAIAAARAGNGGIGAVLIDPDGQEVARAHNQVFKPYFRSDLHAEMNVITQFEDRRRNSGPLNGYVLFTSLEPCPMCVIRIGFAGIARVHYLAADAEGSVARTLEGLAPVWARLARQVAFTEADCSPKLKTLASQIWLATIGLRRVAMSQAP
jgi:tRNA(adenine34) deaminase